MKKNEQDPQRWADRGKGPSVEDDVGAAIRTMGDPDLPDDIALARIQQTVMRPRRRHFAIGRLAVAAGLVLLLGGGVVSAQLGTFPFQRARVSAIGELSVPRGSTVRVRGKRHRKIALVGPAEVTIGNGDGNTDAIALREGLVVIEAGDEPLGISANGLRVTVSSGSSGAVSASAQGQPEAIAIAGTMEVKSAGVTATVGERQIWRRGTTEAATPEVLGTVGRALDEGPPVIAPAPAPAPSPAPAVLPAPAVVPTPAAATPTARRPVGTAPRATRPAPAPVALAIAEPSPPVVVPAEPSPPQHAPPPFPAPPIPVRRALPVPPLAAPQPSVGNPPDAELALIATAVRRLRADDDPRGALVILDEHGARFPTGVLKREATLARVETLLALDRRDEALRVLDEAAVSDLPRARAVRATRGELRAELGRCTDALQDFELLLSSNERDEYAERALYGRAACRARSGDATRVRADLRLYQSLYPNGRFAAEARRLLSAP